MNICIFIGNLTKDPEMSVTSTGKQRCRFTIAVNRKQKNERGTYDADFVTVIAYDKTAELVDKYLAKGRKVAVQTHLKTGSYEKDGKRVYTQDFIVDSVEFLSNKESAAPAAQSAPAQPSAQTSYSSTTAGFTQVDDDELPF